MEFFGWTWTQVTQLEVKLFFESVCGEVRKQLMCHIGGYLTFESFPNTSNLFLAGSAAEATWGLSPFHTHCFCWVCDGMILISVLLSSYLLRMFFLASILNQGVLSFGQCGSELLGISVYIRMKCDVFPVTHSDQWKFFIISEKKNVMPSLLTSCQSLALTFNGISTWCTAA